MSLASKDQYIREILDLYRKTPGTRGRVRPADRRLAERLHRTGISIQLFKAALLLAAGRRTFRDPGLGTLEPIASLHYFLPVLDELQRNNVDPGYFEHIDNRLAEAHPGPRSP
jgi:hypothetical protein